MKKVYNKPEMKVVAINQKHSLLNGASKACAGPSSDFMSNPTISSSRGARNQDDYDDWDE